MTEKVILVGAHLAVVAKGFVVAFALPYLLVYFLLMCIFLITKS